MFFFSAMHCNVIVNINNLCAFCWFILYYVVPSLELLYCLYLPATEYRMKEENNELEIGDVNFRYHA
jgi:hypothetical protein